jgi:hypothetical protein
MGYGSSLRAAALAPRWLGVASVKTIVSPTVSGHGRPAGVSGARFRLTSPPDRLPFALSSLGSRLSRGCRRA